MTTDTQATASSSSTLHVSFTTCGVNLTSMNAILVDAINLVTTLTATLNDWLANTATAYENVQSAESIVTQADSEHVATVSGTNALTIAQTQWQTDINTFDNLSTPYSTNISNGTSLTSSLSTSQQTMLSEFSSNLDIWTALQSLI